MPRRRAEEGEAAAHRPGEALQAIDGVSAGTPDDQPGGGGFECTVCPPPKKMYHQPPLINYNMGCVECQQWKTLFSITGWTWEKIRRERWWGVEK